jgi:hypothetical protein
MPTSFSLIRRSSPFSPGWVTVIATVFVWTPVARLSKRKQASTSQGFWNRWQLPHLQISTRLIQLIPLDDWNQNRPLLAMNFALPI